MNKAALFILLLAGLKGYAQINPDSSLSQFSIHAFDSSARRITASVKDTSLRSFKESVLKVFYDKLGRDSMLVEKDSLKAMIGKMQSRDSIGKKLLGQLGYDPKKMNADSMLKKIKAMPAEEFKKSFGRLKDKFPQIGSTSLKKRVAALLPYDLEEPDRIGSLGGGYVNYQFMYRSMSDTPFVEANLSQHMITAGLDFAVADIPFRLTYYGRQSNSQYLRNYHDFRVEFNGPEFRRLRQQQLRRRIGSLFNDLLDPGQLDEIAGYKNKIQGLKGLLNSPQWLTQYLECRKLLTYRDKLPMEMENPEMVIQSAEQFIKLYDLKRDTLAHFEHIRDSLEGRYRNSYQKVQKLQQVVNGNLYTQQGLDIIKDSLDRANVLDKRTSKFLQAAYAVRRFELGRTVPRLTQLTVNNLNVSGINFEYNAHKLYLAFTAGNIDFRSRDFLYGKPSPIKQYVYAGSIGYGTKEGKHLFLTGYTGRKQIISNAGLAASPLSGMSIEAQWRFGQHILFTAEAAQSTSPAYTSSQGIKTQGFRWNDKSNKAYSLKGYAYFPSTQTRVDAYYQKAGINFQNFTNYRINANASTWNVRLEQMFWKRQLRIMAAARKNDYSNPFVVQQYNTNTVFTSFSATFRRRGLPSLSVGYMPASQYTMVGNQVAENRYQSLNVTTAHAYRIGNMQANGTVMYNRFYNSGTDTGFVYYNANHFYSMHQFAFRMFSANMGYSRTANSQYALDIMEGGLSITYFKKVIVGMGVKINKYNVEESKTGSYFNLRTSSRRLGDFSLWYERGYLPGSKTVLLKNEWFTLGYTRYFNKKLTL